MIDQQESSDGIHFPMATSLESASNLESRLTSPRERGREMPTLFSPYRAVIRVPVIKWENKSASDN